MYGVFSWKKAIAVLGLLVFAGFGIAGAAGRAIGASVRPRELPIYSVETSEKTAALGINCAWDDSDIDRLLGLLDARKIKATFFVVGDWCDRYPEAVGQIAEAGHELGSHSDTHPDMTRLSREEIVQQLTRSQEKLEAASGRKIQLFRPPSGAYNDLVVATARELGFEVIQWSNDSVGCKTPPVGEMVERVCGRAQKGDIMLFHAGKANTPAALEQILDRLTAEGYRFVTVGELIYQPPYALDHTGRQRKTE